MSSVKADRWLNLDGTENFKCRAWVNFNGVGTVSIRDSGNVSSVVDNGVGYYTVNLITAMPNANYATLCSASSITALSSPRSSIAMSLAVNASSFNLYTNLETSTSPAAGRYDMSDIVAIVVGD